MPRTPPPAAHREEPLAAPAGAEADTAGATETYPTYMHIAPRAPAQATDAPQPRHGATDAPPPAPRRAPRRPSLDASTDSGAGSPEPDEEPPGDADTDASGPPRPPPPGRRTATAAPPALRRGDVCRVRRDVEPPAEWLPDNFARIAAGRLVVVDYLDGDWFWAVALGRDSPGQTPGGWMRVTDVARAHPRATTGAQGTHRLILYV